MSSNGFPNSTRVSPNLFWTEMRCKDGTAYPSEWMFTRAVVLAEVFEHIRELCGNKPIDVLSAFRTTEHNRTIGGAPNSQHVQGRALDLRPPAGFTVDRFYRLISEQVLPEGKVRGIGRYATFVHVDTRPSERLVRWTGAGQKDDR